MKAKSEPDGEENPDGVIEMEQTEKQDKNSKKGKALWLLGIGILLGVLIFFAANLRIQYVSIEGNQRYTDEELESLFFKDSLSRNPIVFMITQRMGQSSSIPFVDKYTVTMTGIRSVEIIVYEKEIIGYLNKMGNCMYFDKDGYIVESSSEPMENVPCVTGLQTDYIVLGDKLPVEDDSIFQTVLNITQYLQETEILWDEENRLLVSLVDSIHVETNGNVICRIGDIEVSLGSNKDMEEKLLEMTNILPELEGRKGTLYLDTYDENVDHPTYIFK
ncbi:MAG: cell division protein FtsQ [Clostridiales bacterium]|nr:cell division protein FtsQ [Clostridiales bacterium]